jgi:FKBP-type peptidyl-prolyl cis-trans isomerase FklB
MSNDKLIVPTTDEQKVSYGFGLQFGEQLFNNKFSGMDVEFIKLGLEHALSQQPSVVDDVAMNNAYRTIHDRRQTQVNAQTKELRAEGENFLKQNAQRDGVVTTASGLQYEIIVVGTGDKPQRSSTVSTHYHGTFIDGRVFDSSVQRDEPASFPVDGVISGWTEALQLMSVGSKWRLFVPSQLAYGEQGAGSAIPPHTALIFEVELLEIL